MNVLINKHLRLSLTSQNRSHRQQGAAVIMVYLAITMFLLLSILFLDIPYMERVGRTIQRAVDAAALGAAVQLTRRTATVPLPPRLTVAAERQLGWQFAKRAVFTFLNANPIAGAEALFFDTTGPSGSADSLDLTVWGYENYTKTSSGLTYNLRIERGVYERPASPPTANPIFYSLEVGSIYRSGGTCLANSGGAGIPAACASNPPIEDVADSVRVTLTVSGIPTLFAKVLGINSFASISRIGTSVPE